jgi:hypothetical protein
MSRRVAFVGADISEERLASNIRMIRIGELETTLAVTSNRITLLVFIRSAFRFVVNANVFFAWGFHLP